VGWAAASTAVTGMVSPRTNHRRHHLMTVMDDHG
jgi:hypothetical protein